LQTYLIIGLSDAKIALKSFDELESDYSEILPNYYFYGHEGAISDTLYIQLEDKDILISCGQDLYIFFWDVLKKIAISITDTLHEDYIINMCQINEKIFATCGKDRLIILWSTNDCSHIQTFNYHISTINTIQYNFDTCEFFSASYDKFIRSVKFSENFKEVSLMRIINGHIGSITSAQLDYANEVFITASTDKTIKFWDFKKMQLIKSIETKNEFFDDFIILYDDYNTLVKIDLTKKIKCMDTKAEKSIRL
jgi:WD40 repeat protein